MLAYFNAHAITLTKPTANECLKHNDKLKMVGEFTTFDCDPVCTSSATFKSYQHLNMTYELLRTKMTIFE